MAEPINYTWLEIQRYLNNQMTTGEMHAFEKAMMDDPFLADAHEGYQNADPKLASLHLKEIATQIQEQKEENTVVPLTQKTNNWWRVAAIIILIIGAGSIYYFNLQRNNATTIVAANKTSLPIADSIGPEVKPLETPQLFSNKKEPALANNNNTPIIKQPQKNEPLSMAATSTVMDSATVVANQSIAAFKNSEGNTTPEAESQARLMRKPEQEVRIQPTHEFKGKVLDEVGEPLAFVTVKSKKGVGAVTDSKGNFSIKTTDSILEVSITSMGYMPLNTRLKSNIQQQILLEENVQSLSDVVVTGVGRKKKFDVAIDKNEYLNKKTGYKPVKGWKYFNNYLLKNINNYRDAAEEYMSGDVEI
ncbi:MAG: carboxypeptidase-like regulatory domain-containing protein, partial [Chitinophagaceae bacterium]|nr:carboxypeptidase-like regulatory domain-containing protein [Chitinophagaceae bacterium]